MTARVQSSANKPPATRVTTLGVAGVAMVADLSGVLFWEEQSLLVVSDLHLEKGSSFATRGVLLPPYDTRTTLRRMTALIDAYAPARVIASADGTSKTYGAVRSPRAAAIRIISTSRS